MFAHAGFLFLILYDTIIPYGTYGTYDTAVAPACGCEDVVERSGGEGARGEGTEREREREKERKKEQSSVDFVFHYPCILLCALCPTSL